MVLYPATGITLAIEGILKGRVEYQEVRAGAGW
jgi:hypothetical protein